MCNSRGRYNTQLSYVLLLYRLQTRVSFTPYQFVMPGTRGLVGIFFAALVWRNIQLYIPGILIGVDDILRDILTEKKKKVIPEMLQCYYNK